MAKEDEVSHEAKKEILNESEISLVLDHYDDIFSDFDPRHYHERALSEDFLLEAKRASRDKGDGIELRFLIPRALRNVAHEALIKQRLREHFNKHHLRILEEIRKIRKRGLILTLIGLVIGSAAVIGSIFIANEIVKQLIGILIPTASWFLIWNGFDRLLFYPEQKIPDEEFYRKMTRAHISFVPY